jgi:hypothetical protein
MMMMIIILLIIISLLYIIIIINIIVIIIIIIATIYIYTLLYITLRGLIQGWHKPTQTSHVYFLIQPAAWQAWKDLSAASAKPCKA